MSARCAGIARALRTWYAEPGVGVWRQRVTFVVLCASFGAVFAGAVYAAFHWRSLPLAGAAGAIVGIIWLLLPNVRVRLHWMTEEEVREQESELKRWQLGPVRFQWRVGRESDGPDDRAEAGSD